MNRLETLMGALPEDVDAALITTGLNRRYYTGFASSAGTVLATRKGAWFFIDSRYYEAAKRVVKSCEVVLQEKLYQQVSDMLTGQGVRTLALEGEGVTLRGFSLWKEKLPGAELREDNILSDAINRQRSIKTSRELASIQEAQRISDATFTHILNYIKAGRTERDIALEMEFYSRKNGSEGAAFPFIVVSGVNSSLPHGVPSDKPVEDGDFITMDFGSIVDGYASDMTRTVAMGRVSDRQRRMYALVLQAQLTALEAIRAGAVCREVDARARDLIDASEFKGSFGHGLGHSLGLDVHEDPRFSTADETVLEAGMVMSVEPGSYLEGEFGVRIEDIVAVQGDGYHNFCASPKELLIL